MLLTLTILLAAAVLLVPLSRRAGFGSVLGYLAGGALIGPSGLRLVTDVHTIADISELGVVMLLFLIGLEVRPARLWTLRRAVFALGPAQVVFTAAALAAALHAATHLPWPAATVLGAGLALSSTAIVLPMLAERDLLAAPSGRDTFAVLLFQDLAFIPLVAAVPLLGHPPDLEHGAIPWLTLARGLAAIAAILAAGRFLLPLAFRAIGGARTPEIFNALALFAVAAAASIATAGGLSASLGAFLAGVLLSDSEYRHEVQADIEPFEGLLLGFFFLSVGMGANLGLALHDPLFFAAAVPALLLVKVAAAYLLARLNGSPNADATRFALALPQGSEFSFVLFAAATSAGALAQPAADRATLAIALSMAATPILFALSERLLIPRLARTRRRQPDAIPDTGAPVIICGYGRVGQIVGRILAMHAIPFTALDGDAAQLDVLRRFGSKVYFGNPARPDILRAAGADHAKLLVVALEDVEQSLQVVGVAQRTFPHLRIVARARNRQHVHLLIDRGVTRSVRETFHSSLRLASLVLQDLDISAEEADRAVALFAAQDEQLLLRTHAYQDDERRLIQSARAAAAELATLLQSDQSQRQAPTPPAAPPLPPGEGRGEGRPATKERPK